MFTVYDQQGEKKYQTENVFAAIITAGKMSTKETPHSVSDGARNVFHAFQNKFFKFIGSEYVGEMKIGSDRESAVREAKKWARLNPDSYVVSDDGKEYAALGRREMNPIPEDAFGLEFETGSYVYVFSGREELDPRFIGISYIEFTLDMREVAFRYPHSETEDDWNAYIFANLFTTYPWGSCDIGMISSRGLTEGDWYPIFNHKGMIMPSQDVITSMKKDEYGCFRGQDMLDFRAYVTREKYCLEIFNGRTGKRFCYSVEDEDGALAQKAHRAFGLVAASYCPVTKDTRLWNARSGAQFKGLKFRNIKVARMIENARCADDYRDAEKFDFLLKDGKIFGYGFAQAGDNACYEIGNDDEGEFLTVNISYCDK